MSSTIPLPRILVATVLMVIAAAVTWMITPREELTATTAAVDLESLFPKAFGRWHSEDGLLSPIVAETGDSPDADGGIYAQVLNRTYIDDQGEQILLTVAYGGRQSDSLSMHRPEVCYAAQGFRVLPVHPRVLDVGGHRLDAEVLAAELGARFEPITYWFVIGERVATSRIERKIEQLKYGLTGKIPDGMLVRVSSIERDISAAFVRHEAFINALYAAMDENGRQRLIGAETPAAAATSPPG